ncbi:hypothetical protein DBR32_08640 [Taibaiella sp. KBW10]|uniref:hypothetical protein n=1 Tax=Taibaiella sp. KBW10 TaxID=2153357 RepID=UPI000F5A3DCA|nr:hypothetical protein [Taibaiella sp. KBW10]RQO30780.1 hypothetical protein DBR32_08640 [Taibaiella sp. KBW10]
MKKIFLSATAITLLLTACTDPKTENSTDNKTAAATAGLAKPKAPVAEGIKRILFVGNSHTEFYVSMPDILAALCKENNQNLQIDKLVEMGASIEEILKAQKSTAEKDFALNDKDGNYYDYIILQEKTPVALQELDKYKASSKTLMAMAAKNSPDAAVYVYELMSPLPFKEDPKEFDKYQKDLTNNAVAVAKTLPNAGILPLGTAVAAAYAGKEGYVYDKEGKDQLRFGTNTLHMLNDAGFLGTVLLYETIFGSEPKIPAQLPLATGTGDQDPIKLQEVNTTISNPVALQKIAAAFK